MASPQRENGYIGIANEIVEQLMKINLSSYEWRYLWALWRKTYGWHKTKDFISLSQFEEMTGIITPHICRTQKKLLRHNIIFKDKKGKVGFQKNYKLWMQELPKQALPKQVMSNPPKLPKQVIEITQTGNLNYPNRQFGLPKQAVTKETVTKETVTKEKSGFKEKKKPDTPFSFSKSKTKNKESTPQIFPYSPKELLARCKKFYGRDPTRDELSNFIINEKKRLDVQKSRDDNPNLIKNIIKNKG